MFNKRCRACNTILTEDELDNEYCSGCIEEINEDLDFIYKEADELYTDYYYNEE